MTHNIRRIGVSIIILLVISAGCVFAQTSGNKKAQDYYSSGKKYAEAGKYEKAVGEFKKAVKTDPGFTDAHFRLGLAYSRLVSQGHDEYVLNLISEFETVIQLEPNNKDSYFLLALLGYEKSSDPKCIDKAVQSYEKFIALAPKGDYKIQAAQKNIKQLKNFKEKISPYLESLAGNPKDDKAMTEIGIIYLNNAGTEIAQSYFVKTIKLNAKSAQAHLGLAQVYLSKYISQKLDSSPEIKKMPSPAQKDAQTGMDKIVHTAMEKNYGFAKKNENLSKSAEECKQALKLDTNMAQANFLFALICDEQGDTKQALEYYQKFIKLNTPSKSNDLEYAKHRVGELR